jgi:hypothetical protein
MYADVMETAWIPDISGELRVLLAEAEENTGNPEMTMVIIRERCKEAGYHEQS